MILVTIIFIQKHDGKLECICNAYNYYLKKNKQKNGNVYIIYESAVSVYLYDIGVNWKMFEFNYIYETNRDEMEINCHELNI